MSFHADAFRTFVDAIKAESDPSADSRPRACVLVGNGFTLGSQEDYGLAPGYNLTNLIPQSPHVPYIAMAGESSHHHSLWHEDNFPKLWRAWHDATATCSSPLDFNTFVATLDDPVVALPNGKRAIRYPPAGAATELRIYLWHLFVSMMRSIRNQDPPTKKSAAWMCLRQLSHEARLTVISYNYDTLIENACSYLAPAGTRIVETPSFTLLRWLGRADRSVYFIKPHGSISHDAGQMPMIPLRFSPGWWRTPEDLPHGILSDSAGMYSAGPLFPNFCDYVPNIVLPGHGQNLAPNQYNDSLRTCELAVADADLLVIIGFRAAPPDDQEFMHILRAASPHLPVIFAGRHSDMNSPCASLLNDTNRRWIFLDVDNADDQKRLSEPLTTLGVTRTSHKDADLASALLRMAGGELGPSDIERFTSTGLRWMPKDAPPESLRQMIEE